MASTSIAIPSQTGESLIYLNTETGNPSLTGSSASASGSTQSATGSSYATASGTLQSNGGSATGSLASGGGSATGSSASGSGLATRSLATGSRSVALSNSVTGTLQNNGGSATLATGSLASGSGSMPSFGTDSQSAGSQSGPSVTNTMTMSNAAGSQGTSGGTYTNSLSAPNPSVTAIVASGSGTGQSGSSNLGGPGTMGTAAGLPTANSNTGTAPYASQSGGIVPSLSNGLPGPSNVQTPITPGPATISTAIGLQPTPCQPLPFSASSALSSGSGPSSGSQLSSASAAMNVPMCIGGVTISNSGANQGTSALTNSGTGSSGFSTSIIASSSGGSASVGSAVTGSSINTAAPASITSMLNPTGVAASASASSLQVALIYAQRAIQNYINKPTDDNLKKLAEDEIDRAKDLSDTLADELPKPGGGGSDCGHGSGILGALENVVSCSVDTLKKLGDDVEGGTDDIENLKNDLTDLGTYVQPLVPDEPVPDPPEDDPHESLPQPSATQQDDQPSSQVQSSQPQSSPASVTSPSITSSVSQASSTLASTSASESGPRSQYVVYAKVTADMNSLNSYISSIVPSPSSVTFIQATSVIAFWGVPAEATDGAIAGLTPSEVAELKQQPGIDDVVANAPLTALTDPAANGAPTSAGGPSVITLTIQPTAADDISPATAGGPATDTAQPAQSGSPAGRKRFVPVANKRRNAGHIIDNELDERDMSLSTGQDRQTKRLEKRMPPPYAVTIQERAVPPRTDGLDVPYELRAVSQPNINPLPDLDALDYVYRVAGGQNTWAYVIDSGLLASHQEFQHGCNIVPNNEWIIVPGATSANDDPNGHGTAVTSKICGQIGGVAKLTTIIPVKINTDNILSWTSMWTRTLNDIQQRQANNNGALPGKTVVNFSNGYSQASNTFDIQRVKPILAQIMALGVPIVVAAGNDRETAGADIVKAPGTWAAPDFPLIVVSSVDRNFQASSFSQYGTQTSVWAIGEDNVVGWPTGNAAFRVNIDGTSFGEYSFLTAGFYYSGSGLMVI